MSEVYTALLHGLQEIAEIENNYKALSAVNDELSLYESFSDDLISPLIEGYSDLTDDTIDEEDQVKEAIWDWEEVNGKWARVNKSLKANESDELKESGALWNDEIFDIYHDSDDYPLKNKIVYPWTWEGPDENGKYKRVSTIDGHIIGREEADRIDYELRHKKKLGDVNESVEKHDTLNQKIFNGDELDPEVKEKLLEIVDRFKYNLEENDIKLDIKDVRIIGSNASYNYTDKSDIDLHIFADLSVYPDQEVLAQKVYDAYKALWNNKFDPIIRGHEVEIYVEPYTGD